MAPLLLEDLILPTAISLLHAYQLTTFARKVGAARGKYKVPYPQTTGDDNFMRYFRAQQNTIEFAPVFFPVLWGASLFFHPVPAAVAGVVYWYGRSSYFSGYIEEVKGRIHGFHICVNAIKALLFMAGSGLIHSGLVHYADVNLKQMIMDRLNM